MLITLKDLQLFLRFCNFYQIFLKNYSYIIRLLFKLLVKEAWYKLDKKKLKAFKLIKILVLSNKIRAYYLLYKET